MPHRNPASSLRLTGSAVEVFRAFLGLGLTSFGGPVAHLGYFRSEFVQRRHWLDDRQFAQLLAVCQFLPGPASSQLGFALGLLRAGWRGAMAAFIGFTLPSALLMLGFGAIALRLDGGVGAALVHGLKLVAVAVVAHGLLGMIRQLTPDLPRALIACGALGVILLTGRAWGQLAAIALGSVLGLGLGQRVQLPPAVTFPLRYGVRGASIALVLFALGLGTSWLLPRSGAPTLPGIAAAFYESGALVFGGGHVVLPLLQQAMVEPGWVSQDRFLAGYGAAQAMPGPMFSLAAYLGAEVPVSAPCAAAALLALLSMFLPGFLLLLAVLPFWNQWAQRPSAARAMAGIGASVVGLLAAALHDPVWTQGIRSPVDFAIAAAGFAMLAALRISAVWVVLWCVLAATLVQRLG